MTPQGTVSATYDAAGRRTTLTVPGQPTVSYSYDTADRVTQITQGASIVTLVYDAAGRRTSLTLPNGVVTEYAYDAASRLTGLTYRKDAATLGTSTYAYDAAGNRIQTGGSWARTGLPQPVAAATYNAANHQLTFGAQSLSYDLNGNLVSDGTTTYTWDARNRLVSLTGPGLTGSFQYDPLGRRTRKTINGAMTDFLYDGLNPVREIGATTAELLTGLGIDEYLTRTDAGGTRAFLTDALGSTVALTDGTGAVGTAYTYEPFGAATVAGGGGNAFQFTGRENDGTGLYYYRARYYQPGLQRFLEPDPIRFSGGDVNLYSYVLNNPLRFMDPLGLWRNPFAIYRDAISSARNSGLRDAPFDAYQHCVASCEFVQENGELPAWLAGWANEKWGDWRGQRSGDRAMDDANNAVGRELGKAATCRDDCEQACRGALNDGRLQTAGWGKGPRYWLPLIGR